MEDLKVWMEKRELSNAKVAKLFGVAVGVVQRIKGGKKVRNSSLEKVLKGMQTEEVKV